MEDINAVLDKICSSAIQLVQATPGAVSRLRLQAGSATVEMEWVARGTQSGDLPPPAVITAETVADEGAEVTYLRAPMIGTFYRSPAPGEPPFVREGDMVEAGTQVGILEAMKLMNPIEADQPGRVVEVLVSDGTPVEYDQQLIVVTPALDG
ncbi:acetyl-CoA carboxylase biotin carboxyl carrier protein [Salinispora oceanensis]|uniref:acetyl-CoA carboxylase biotin carboxyl carrier protein n=1 Tax=Salinispora oceanensis TaxID=1050199 RepID=UPI00035D431E|nr:acetyl-CoA carboxylase biotin carboxyl carrier protein [Salinispora oceanensis]